MSSSKTLIVVKSVHHGNTAKIAEALAEELAAEVRDPDETPSENWEDYELIGFGSGIYFGMFHPETACQSNSTPGVCVFDFGVAFPQPALASAPEAVITEERPNGHRRVSLSGLRYGGPAALAWGHQSAPAE